MSFIYVITNDINGKQYVGKTNWTIEKRFKEHIKDSKRERCEKRPLYNAMNKYGIEHFSVEQLEECDESIVNEREQYWIQKLNTYGKTGYNATLGGDSKHYYNYQEVANKYLELQSLTKVCQYFQCDPQTVKVACQQQQVKMLTSAEATKKALGKTVIMLDKETEKPLKVFESAKDAGQYLADTEISKSKIIKGIASHVTKVCRGERTQAFGYKWKYIGD